MCEWKTKIQPWKIMWLAAGRLYALRERNPLNTLVSPSNCLLIIYKLLLPSWCKARRWSRLRGAAITVQVLISGGAPALFFYFHRRILKRKRKLDQPSHEWGWVTVSSSVFPEGQSLCHTSVSGARLVSAQVVCCLHLVGSLDSLALSLAQLPGLL